MLQVDNGVPVSMNALDINSPQSEVAGNVICTARGEHALSWYLVFIQDPVFIPLNLYPVCINKLGIY